MGSCFHSLEISPNTVLHPFPPTLELFQPQSPDTVKIVVTPAHSALLHILWKTVNLTSISCCSHFVLFEGSKTIPEQLMFSPLLPHLLSLQWHLALKLNDLPWKIQRAQSFLKLQSSTLLSTAASVSHLLFTSLRNKSHTMSHKEAETEKDLQVNSLNLLSQHG